MKPITKRTAQNARKLCELVARGLPYAHACSIVGISQSCFFDWKREDQQFAAQLELAVAEGIDQRLKIIVESSKNDWRCAAWWLERTLPQFFARSRLEVSGPDGSPLAAGVQFYLPKKEPLPTVESDPVPLIAERNGDGN